MMTSKTLSLLNGSLKKRLCSYRDNTKLNDDIIGCIAMCYNHHLILTYSTNKHLHYSMRMFNIQQVHHTGHNVEEMRFLENILILEITSARELVESNE